MKRHIQTNFWVAWEVEEEETMETSLSSATASTSKLRATSFFPLWKLKWSQPAITPNKDDSIDSEDLDGIEGITEEFIVHLARAVKDAQQAEKHCYPCDSLDHFICDCPQLAGMKANVP